MLQRAANEYGNKLSIFIIGAEFTDQLNNHQALKKACTQSNSKMF